MNNQKSSDRAISRVKIRYSLYLMEKHTKFSFEPSFQREILRFAVTDSKYGFKAVVLFESHFFTRIEDSIIAEVLKRYYVKRYSTPSYPIFLEELKQLLRNKQWANLVSDEDKKKVRTVARKLYSRPVKDPETIYDSCKKFAQMMALKSTLEDINILDFNSYADIAAKIHHSISLGSDLREDAGTFLLADAKVRTLRRSDQPPGYPTPWWQLNRTMNSGGTNKGNIIVVLGPAKRFKTGFLMNTAIGYLKQGRKVLIVDLENGEEALSMRGDQSLINVDRKTLLSDDKEINEKLLKKARQYKRFGGDVNIRRFVAGSTTADIQRHITWLAENKGFIVTDLICDYPDLMAPLKGVNKNSDTDNISNVYIDLKTLAEDNNINSIWCPSHVNREGDKVQGKKFKATDIAKAIDKVRHADMVLGMQQDEEEKEAGIIRLEIIDQRDGTPDGRVYLWGKLDTQRVREFTRAEVKEMEELRAEMDSEEEGSGGAASKFTQKDKPTVSDM